MDSFEDTIVTSCDLDQVIIMMVEKYPQLYDTKSRNFKDKLMTEKNWSEISAAMNLDVEIVRSRWNNLRDKFVRSLHRKSDPRCAETEPFLTKKPFPYKSQMMWLSPFIKKRRTAASLNALAREVNLNFLEHYEKHKDVSQIACKSNSPWDLLLVMTPSEENTDNNDSWTRNETSVPLFENNKTLVKNTIKREYQQCSKKRPPSDTQSNFPEKFYKKSMNKNEELINSIGKVSASFDKLVEGMGTRNSVPVSRNGHEAFAQSVVADMLLMSRKDCNMFKREVLELVGKYLPDD
uniref:MADF domain-containing protein n=1 Tax=Timema tahoe TaxID=61484 RepID=A0A7R9IIF3_9NEOP|nr:unnamed protein product [Timema tahoe]